MPEVSYPASLIAGLLLLLRDLLPALKGLPKTVAEILALTCAGKSQAYAMRDRLRELLPTLIGAPGRPALRSSERCGECDECPVLIAVRDYLLTHPGAVCWSEGRSTYHDGFRRFVVGLVAPGQPGEVFSESRLAHLTGVPVGTIHDWLNPQLRSRSTSSPSPGPSADGQVEASPETADEFIHSAVGETASDTSRETDSTPLKIPDAHVRFIVSQWKSWEGTFQAFCQMVRKEYRIPHGDTYIGDVLQAFGLRQRRRQIPVEAPWSSNTYRTFFPGAQWLADGTELAITLGGQRFVFNLEAILDVFSTAMLGLHVSKTETEEALRHAYEAAKTTGGAPPKAMTVDNKKCNLSPGAQETLGDTITLHATLYRGQAKAPLEGAFGTLQQTLPPLVVTGNTLEEQAASILLLVAIAFYRGRNGRPRKRLGGRTPADVYLNDKASSEELQAALEWFRELQRQQEQMRLTREARRDPVRLTLLKQGLAKLGIPDPDNHLAISLAYYSREAIARGLATFQAKKDTDTLPPSLTNHGRYLGGIIKNLHTKFELEAFSTRILEQRIRLHDLSLAPLKRAADDIRSELPLQDHPQAFVDRALHAQYAVDFRFWAEAAAKALEALSAALREQLYAPLTRRIAASFKVDAQRRADLIDRIAEAQASAA